MLEEYIKDITDELKQVNNRLEHHQKEVRAFVREREKLTQILESLKDLEKMEKQGMFHKGQDRT